MELIYFKNPRYNEAVAVQCKKPFSKKCFTGLIHRWSSHVWNLCNSLAPTVVTSAQTLGPHFQFSFRWLFIHSEKYLIYESKIWLDLARDLLIIGLTKFLVNSTKWICFIQSKIVSLDMIWLNPVKEAEKWVRSKSLFGGLIWISKYI